MNFTVKPLTHRETQTRPQSKTEQAPEQTEKFNKFLCKQQTENTLHRKTGMPRSYCLKSELTLSTSTFIVSVEIRGLNFI